MRSRNPKPDLPDNFDNAQEMEEPWRSLPLDQAIQEFKDDPGFQAYAKSLGVYFEPPKSTRIMPEPTEFNPMNSEEFLSRVIAGTIAALQLGGVKGTGKPTSGTVFVPFPEPKEVEFTLPDGTREKRPMPFYPINIGAKDYQYTDHYPAEIAEILKEEIAGAELVNIPWNAAFIEKVFIRTDEDGKRKKEVEMFTGPVFAGKSLAHDLKEQLAHLEKMTLPYGEISGTKTRYDDQITNGVRLCAGQSYWVPKSVKYDLERRIQLHEQAYQNAGKSMGKMGQEGYRVSRFHGAQISAAEAEARQGPDKEQWKPERVVEAIGPEIYSQE